MNIIATTHVDSHGDKLSLSTLVDMRNIINEERTIRMSLNHDPLFPPLGQFTNARILKDNESGEYLLAADMLVYDLYEQIEEDEKLIRNYSVNSKSFNEIKFKASENLQIDVDFFNFNSSEDIKQFCDEMSDSVDENIIIHEKVRKELLPTPELIITLAEYYILYKLLKPIGVKVTEKITDKISDDIAKTYDKIKSIIVRSVKYLNKNNRPILYLIEIPNEEIHIQLACKVTIENMDDFLEGCKTEILQEVVRKGMNYKEMFEGEKCQFTLNDTGNWELSYLLCKNGNVIGKKELFKERDAKYKIMLDTGQFGFSSGMRIGDNLNEKEKQ